MSDTKELVRFRLKEGNLMSNVSRPTDVWRFGLMVGFIAGALDAAIIILAEPTASAWGIAQAVIAWTLTGWVVTATDSGLRPFAHGLVVTVLLNVPWYIQFTILPGQWSLLPPLVVMSLLFGAGFGWAKKRYVLRRERDAQ